MIYGKSICSARRRAGGREHIRGLGRRQARRRLSLRCGRVAANRQHLERRGGAGGEGGEEDR